MHIHIVGICGTFMGGLAQLAKAMGHRVTGCDANVYPPMSDQLVASGIELIQGFEADQLALKPDLWVVGNVARRGLPLIEAILNQRLPMSSGPAFLAEHVMVGRPVAAVAGTHGKTTTSSLLAWVLEQSGLSPGFLIGGVPEGFGVSARMGRPDGVFVIEADEYDTAFFDKRSKFLHYRAQVAILNNLEFDHADIFADLAAIETQFHHWIRTLPSEGCLVVNGQSEALRRVIARACYTPVTWFNDDRGLQTKAPNRPDPQHNSPAGRETFDIYQADQCLGQLVSPLWGEHNRANALAVLGAAMALGVPAEQAMAAMASFPGVKRRMQLRGESAGIRVWDDFAHHPTAIQTTLQGLARQLATGQRILAVIEPRSNTMKMGVMRDQLPTSLSQADLVFGYSGGLDWSLEQTLAGLGSRACVREQLDDLINAIVEQARAGDQILVMSNGGFGGLHERLLSRLAERQGR
ncbi:UDP-N-acetylmuramate:L-alanyl-gamma-D-glutamyl-meso-diaminopimelate ligase [Betaproteobacteria bacterium LSUCC0115]|nr:UDP-N-acetylmuramate:L-alanyl-gamma-D-glutamyl-meso-diaminopimelate ligase [Burkholderiales bacterium LSUCC0115]